MTDRAAGRSGPFDVAAVTQRVLVVVALAGFIAGVYVAIVAGVGTVVGRDSFGLSIVAALVVAMAFQPVRRRVQRWANRVVHGERATPYEVLVRFSRRSAELSDEELLARVPQLIVEGTGAESATLWTRTATGFRTASSWPADPAPRVIEGTDRFEDTSAEVSLPILHGGELLGGLSLMTPGGDAVAPTEAGLLTDMAAGLGLALRNARLTDELRHQVAELEASRERVLEAADEARRALEHDLDSGPQQQLVALKVKLGPTRTLAERAGADKTAALLRQLEDDAGDAIKAVRNFAAGIHPPLLEAEGLQAAIQQQVRNAAIPTTVAGDGIRRYGRDVEVAVYFSVLEALQNASKYAEASSVTVHLVHDGPTLEFEVRDDGRGFDISTTDPGAGLTSIADRLDTVGGSVSIDSTPGHGTTITGAVPVGAQVEA